MIAGRPGPVLGRTLLASAFFVATCGLVYELVAGALASYLVGDSVTWFSLVIGTYLSAMGLGSWLSRFVERGLLARFVELEVTVALVGGFEAPALMAAYTWTDAFRPLLFAIVALVGVLVGLELPLLIRILEGRGSLRELVARVLALDYVGALVASVAFPLVFVPRLGLLRTSLALGLVNAGVALATAWLLAEAGPVRRRLLGLAGGAAAVLAAGLALGARVEEAMEARLFADPVVLHRVTPYQRIVVTHRDGDTRLYLDGALQFSSVDEYRYHEALVHPALGAVERPARVLVLGGGDGLAVREVLRHPEVEEVVLVDLDPEMVALFRDRPELAALNGGAFHDPRVRTVSADALTWLDAAPRRLFDAAIVDFPDPGRYALGKLFSVTFYRRLARHLAPGAAVSVQATSPLFAREAYACIVRTLRHAGYAVRPYHVYVPSFGAWGFVLAGLDGPPRVRRLPAGLRFLDRATLEAAFHFPPDMAPDPEGPVNRLDNQVLVRLYEKGWKETWGL